MNPPRWLCAQLGAREHYAIPRALQAEGRLQTLFTDFWAGPILRSFANGPLGSMAGRWHPELPSTSVCAWNGSTLWAEAIRRLRSLNGKPEDIFFSRYIECGKEFARRVSTELRRRSDLAPNTFFFGYDTASLEILEVLRGRGISCVIDQVDLHRAEATLVQEEAQRWSGWAYDSAPFSEAYAQRREREWALAERVVVNSDFAQRGLLEQGLSADKIVVLPLIYESPSLPLACTRKPISPTRDHPLRVLFLGQVILRKGIPYLFEAARLLRDEPVEFAIVGPIGITPMARQTAPTNVRFYGRATRHQVASYYQETDLFVLPTLSDSFALTQLEALAHGLPVIATPNCGEVVSDGCDGWIVPPRDASALARAISRYLTDPKLLEAHSHAARTKAEQFRMPRLRRGLLALERNLSHA